MTRDFSYTTGMTLQLTVVALLVGGANAAILTSPFPDLLVIITGIGGIYGVAWAVMSNVEQYVFDHQDQITE